jgi:hypothetical protein
MDAYMTQEGRREDLEAIEVNPVLGYIGNKVLPVMTTTQKVGENYFTMLTADDAAQAGVARGTALTTVRLTESHSAYSCASVEKRYAVPRDEVKQMGGIEKADRLGGMAAKRSVQRYVETAIAAVVQATTNHQTAAHVAGSFLSEAEIALSAIRRYPGRRALVLGESAFRGVMKYTEVQNQFSLAALAIGGSSAEAMLAGRPEALRMLLAGIVGVDEVLVGDDTHWGVGVGASGIGCNGSFVVLPGEDEFSQKLDPVYGKFVQYLPDGKQPFLLESYYDLSLKENVYDAETWYSIEEFNPLANYVLTDLIA